MKRIIMDTDIGTDVDDCLALAVLLASPEVALEAVTCVYGDVALRARMVAKLLRLAGRDDVPVYLGACPPLLGLRPIYWPGHEGLGLLRDDDPPPIGQPLGAVDLLVETIMASPGEIHLLAIGPLTNVALALRKEPHIAQNLASLMIMGGVFRGPGRFHLPYAEHNIVCDPEAAHIVMTSGAPIVLVPLDVTTEVRVFPDGAAQIRGGGTPYHAAVADQIARYPGFVARGWTHLHDPLAAALLIDPSFATLEPLHVEVELGGRLSVAATLARAPSEAHPANAQVALGVDAPRFERWFVERAAGQIVHR